MQPSAPDMHLYASLYKSAERLLTRSFYGAILTSIPRYDRIAQNARHAAQRASFNACAARSARHAKAGTYYHAAASRKGKTRNRSHDNRAPNMIACPA